MEHPIKITNHMCWYTNSSNYLRTSTNIFVFVTIDLEEMFKIIIAIDEWCIHFLSTSHGCEVFEYSTGKSKLLC